jgi:hypothetical protein
LWIALAAVPVVLLLADTLYWRLAAQRLQSGFAGWVAARQAAGWTVSAGAPQPGGWPLTATLTVPDLALAGGETSIPGGLSWHAATVALRVALWRPTLLQVDASGEQVLRAGEMPPVTYTAEQMRAELPLQPNAPSDTIAVHGAGLRAAAPGTRFSIGTLDIRLEMQSGAGRDDPALGFSLGAHAITLPPDRRWPLGQSIASLRLGGAVDGPLPESIGMAARAAAWRDAGGSIDLRQFALQWGPLQLSGTATLALDPQLQPMGAGTATVVGYAETLDALASGGLLSRSAAIAAKAVLSLLAQTSDNGQPSEVEVPLTLQYRTLSMRQVPLVRLPELDWPQQ